MSGGRIPPNPHTKSALAGYQAIKAVRGMKERVLIWRFRKFQNIRAESRVLQLPRPSQNQLDLFVVLQLGLKLQNANFWDI